MTTTKIETLILKNLMTRESYSRKTLPYLSKDLFQERVDSILFEEIEKHFREYNNPPKFESLRLAITNREDLISEGELKDLQDNITQIENDKVESDLEHITDETEKFCQDRSLYNAMLESIEIMDGKNKKKTKQIIPELVRKALSISFDPNIGHNYFDDVGARYEFYHRSQNKIPFDLQYFNLITNGGLAPKTLTVIMGGTNVGKSLIMCHFAASFLAQHKNVLYITLEMSEEKIAQRIDANLLDVPMDELLLLPKEEYLRRVERKKDTYKGKLIIKEYPTSAAHANHFRALIDDLRLKLQFIPDVVFVDYVNICASSRFTGDSGMGSYGYIKAIAEELRGLAVEYNFPLITGTQTNRAGYSSTDPDLTNTAESFGLPATADLYLSAVNSDALMAEGKIMFTQLKNRDEDVNKNKKFVVGIDRPRMRLYDVEQGFLATEHQPNASGRTQIAKYAKAGIETRNPLNE